MSALVLLGAYSTSLVKKDQYEKAFLITSYLGICGLVITVSTSSGLNDPGMMILFPTLVVISYFSDRRSIIILGIALISWFWSLFYFQYTGITRLEEPHIGLFGTALSMSLILIFSLVLLQFTTNQMKSIIAK
ncbi:MAG: hypothetical protein AAGD96_20260, partial [Chloroflexota bacterium]